MSADYIALLVAEMDACGQRIEQRFAEFDACRRATLRSLGAVAEAFDAALLHTTTNNAGSSGGEDVFGDDHG